ncbi:hypothetical protein [Roseomonas elaeocarpi]|uniref:Flagellar hook-length control protein FliK n=1 Tax=Roseomonas elaeocarpi TaxID=907779 RepID=A0ABV6JTU8_9PROT
MLDALRLSAGSAVAPAGSLTAPAAQPATAAAATPSATPLSPNPKITFDPEIDRLVMEFRDSDGKVQSSLPSAKELQAYRWAARTGAAEPGTAPQPAARPDAAPGAAPAAALS